MDLLVVVQIPPQVVADRILQDRRNFPAAHGHVMLEAVPADELHQVLQLGSSEDPESRVFVLKTWPIFARLFRDGPIVKKSQSVLDINLQTVAVVWSIWCIRQKFSRLIYTGRFPRINDPIAFGRFDESVALRGRLFEH